MTHKNIFPLTTLLLSAVILVVPARAEEEGQADLDEAVGVQLFAKSPADLDRVVRLCESALRKGLEEDNQNIAKQLMAASLYQHAEVLTRPILAVERPDPRWPQLRELALPKLQRAVQVDEDFGDAHYLIAKLHSLPGGSQKAASDAVEKAIRFAGDDNRKVSRALLLRGDISPDETDKLADYNQAVAVDPSNQEAWKTRAVYHLSKDDHEKATADFKKLLEQDDTNITAHHGLAEAYTYMQKFDEALKYIEKAIKIDERSAMNFSLRARIYMVQNNLDAALKDLNSALEVEPRNVPALLMRGRLHQALAARSAAKNDTSKMDSQLALAKKDSQLALALQPNLTQAILLRSMVAAAADDFVTAAKHMKQLIEKDPENLAWRLQLAAFYVNDQRPRKAIKAYSEILEADPDNLIALRHRGDALLSIGEHAKAVKDYEEALSVDPKHSGALNNLAWVLATSPKDEVRDGKRSVKLGLQACEVTEYKEAHILSTLAAGYAESGDFETALKWSGKAVDLGGEEVKEQLQQELSGYKQGKPWREFQEVKEKPEPTRGGGDFEL